MARRSTHGTVLVACESDTDVSTALPAASLEAARRQLPLVVLETSPHAAGTAGTGPAGTVPSSAQPQVERILLASQDDPAAVAALDRAVLLVVAGREPGGLGRSLASVARVPVLVARPDGALRQSVPERRPQVRVGWSGLGDESHLLRAAAREAKLRDWVLGVVNVVPRAHRGQRLRHEQDAAWRAVHAVPECREVPSHVTVSQDEPVQALVGACRPEDLLVVAARYSWSPGSADVPPQSGDLPPGVPAELGRDPVLPGILDALPCDVLVVPAPDRARHEGDEWRGRHRGEAPAEGLRALVEPRTVAVLADRGSPLRAEPAVPVVVATRRRVRGGPVEYVLPYPADLAVVSVGPAEVPAALEACVRAGVGGVAVMRRGAGPAVEDLLASVEEVCRPAGVRVLGPGSELLANLHPRVGVHAGRPLQVDGVAGHLAVVSDGAPGVTRVMRALASHALGVGLVVDVGAAADVTVPEIAAWVATRGEVPAVLVHSSVPCRQDLEHAVAGMGMPSVPVVLMAPDAVVTPAPPQAAAGPAPSPTRSRILRAGTLEEMANLALLLVGQPAPAGRHVAFVTNEPWASHAGVNRHLAGAGLLGPDLTQYAEARSKVLAPGARMRGAVISLLPDVSADSLSQVLTTVTEERGVDAVVVAPTSGPHLHRADVERVLGTVRQSHPDVVVVAVDQGGARPKRWRSSVVPVFDSDRRAVDALAGLIHA